MTGPRINRCYFNATCAKLKFAAHLRWRRRNVDADGFVTRELGLRSCTLTSPRKLCRLSKLREAIKTNYRRAGPSHSRVFACDSASVCETGLTLWCNIPTYIYRNYCEEQFSPLCWCVKLLSAILHPRQVDGIASSSSRDKIEAQ